MRRPRTSLVVLPVLGLALFAACGPVDPPPASVVPFNTCSGGNSCDGYAEGPLAAASCSGGRCLSFTQVAFKLVVSLPESSSYGPGIKVASELEQLLTAGSASERCAPPSCGRLPSLVSTVGSLVVSGLVQQKVGHDLGNGGAGTALPVHVTYYPLAPSVWPPPPNTVFVEAATVGIPLVPSRALVTRTSFVNGPFGTFGAVWHGSLAPGVYERDVVPDDEAYPPEVKIMQIVAPSQPEIDPLTDVDTVGLRQLTVTRLDASLAGFAAYLRTNVTHHRASSRVALRDVPQKDGSVSSTVTLHTIHTPSLLDGSTKPPKALFEVVVEPPAGAPIPTLVGAQLSDALGTLPFPKLPVPVAVSGVVLAPNLSPIEADLIIDSTDFNPTTGTGGIETVEPKDAARGQVHYSTTAHARGDGRYSVTLPPGEYSVFVVPTASTVAAARENRLTIASTSKDHVAAGLTLLAAAFGGIRGTAGVSDGRPLARTVIDALPSASLKPSVDPRRWPAQRSTVTADDGSYFLALDPGVYDVVARPAEGTAFPSVLSYARTVLEGQTLTLDPLVVPAPILSDLGSLYDVTDNPVRFAVVRAFAVPKAAASPGPGVSAPSVEIGQWMTDAAGHLEMYVVPPQ